MIRRSFEERYQERASGASLLGNHASQQRDTDRKDTPHLTLTTSPSDAVVAPGTRFSLWVDITPKPTMHVYAPEQKDYIPIEISLETDESFKVWPPVFPKGEKFFFAPLKETQLVFSKPFRIVQDVTVSLSAPVRQRAACRGSDADDQRHVALPGVRRQGLLSAAVHSTVVDRWLEATGSESVAASEPSS